MTNVRFLSVAAVVDTTRLILETYLFLLVQGCNPVSMLLYYGTKANVLQPCSFSSYPSNDGQLGERAGGLAKNDGQLGERAGGLAEPRSA